MKNPKIGTKPTVKRRKVAAIETPRRVEESEIESEIGIEIGIGIEADEIEVEVEVAATPVIQANTENNMFVTNIRTGRTYILACAVLLLLQLRPITNH